MIYTLAKVLNVSDLFSFYKEELSGDQGNLVHRYARIHGKTVQQSLEDISSRLVFRDATVKAILGDGKAREAWELFTSGYIQFHILCPRYKLRAVLPEYH